MSLNELYIEYNEVKNRLDEINQEYAKLPNWKKYYANDNLAMALKILKKIDELNSIYSEEAKNLSIRLNLIVTGIEHLEKLNNLLKR